MFRFEVNTELIKLIEIDSKPSLWLKFRFKAEIDA